MNPITYLESGGMSAGGAWLVTIVIAWGLVMLFVGIVEKIGGPR